MTATPRVVQDVMTRDPACVHPSDSVREIARVLDENEISGVPVIDMKERVIGVVSKTDIMHRVLTGPVGSRPGSFFESMAEGLGAGTDLDPEELGVAEEFMSTDLVTAAVDEPLGRVARRMAERRVHRAVVVDDAGKLVGIVTALDMLRAFPGGCGCRHDRKAVTVEVTTS